MKYLHIGLLIFAAGLMVACQKEAPPAAPVEQVAKLPTGTDAGEWRAYLGGIAREYQGKGKRGLKPFPMLIPAGEDPQRHIDYLAEIFERGIDKGTVLLIVSPDSQLAADAIVKLFNQVPADDSARLGRAGVVFVFIGKPENEAQVRDAVAPSGMDFRFHEMK